MQKEKSDASDAGWVLWMPYTNAQTNRPLTFMLYSANVVLYKPLYGKYLFDVNKPLI